MAPNKSKRGNAPAAAAASMPKFTADALTQLTAKIDQNLENRNSQKLNGSSNGAGKRKRGADAGGDDDKEPAGAKPPKTQKKKTAAAPQPKPKAKPAPPAKAAKKAVSGANDIAVGKPKKEASPETSEETLEESSDEASGGPDKKAIMLDEIKALGGDEADLELVDGIDSDAEEDSRSSGKRAGNDDMRLDASFQSELAKFAAGLGFDQVQLEDEDDDFMEREAEAEADEEEEDDEEEEEEEEKEIEEAKPKAAEPPKTEAKPAPSTDPFPKNPRFSKLVSLP